MSTPRLSVVLHAHAPLAPRASAGTGDSSLLALCEHGLLPLLAWLDEVADRGGRDGPLLTLAVSPTLLNQLADRATRVELDVHLEARLAAAQSELARIEATGHAYFARLAARQRDRLLDLLERLRERYGGDLVRALTELRDRGGVALIPSAGTHPVLPLIEPAGLRDLHVAAACAEFRYHLGATPNGMWLPEGAWAAGLGQVLRSRGLDFAIVAAAGLRPRLSAPDEDWLPPVRTDEGVIVWPEASGLRAALVGAEGARRDPAFLHQPAASSADLAYFARGDEGEGVVPYDAALARERARDLGTELAGSVLRATGAPRLLALELTSVGPAWPEGLWVLRALVEAFEAAGGELGLPGTSAPDSLASAEPVAASWRRDGYFGTWVDEDVGWVYRRLARLGTELWRLRIGAPRASRAWRRTYERALRALLLAQSSNWCEDVVEGRNVGRAAAELEALLGRARAELERLAAGDDAASDSPERGGRLFGDLMALLG